jgi:methionyl-tRNA synthetase
MYNAKLANNFGNLVNRVVVLSLRLSENTGILTPPQVPLIEGEANPSQQGELYHKNIQKLFSQYNLKAVLDTSFEHLDSLNKFADETQPWQTIKDNEDITRQNLYILAE